MPWGCIGFGFPYSWHLYWVVDVCLDTLRLDNTYLYTLNEHRWLSVPLIKSSPHPVSPGVVSCGNT